MKYAEKARKIVGGIIGKSKREEKEQIIKHTSKYASEVREMIRAIERQEAEQEKKREIWQVFQRHSREYMEALELTPADVEKLDRGLPRLMTIYPHLVEMGSGRFLKFTMEGEEFALRTENVCGSPYGGDWTYSILAECLTNPSLNFSVGGGTTFINVVPEEWHCKILRHLKEENDASPIDLPDTLKHLW